MMQAKIDGASDLTNFCIRLDGSERTSSQEHSSWIVSREI